MSAAGDSAFWILLPTPVKPMKARARIPATINVIAAPRKAAGTSASSSSSRIPAINTMAMVNPTPPKIASTSDSSSPYSLASTCFIISRQAKRIAQLVVISGKKTPNDRYSGGKNLRIYISTNWTLAAITKM